MDDPEDFEGLLSDLRADKEGVLADAFTQHRERLCRVVDLRLGQRLRGRVDVDDVLQEAYLQAIPRVEHYLNDPSVSLFIWLRSIACQTLIDLHRRHLGAQMRDASREIFFDGRRCSEASSAVLANILLGSLTSPSAAAVRDEIADQVQVALEQMAPVDREVLILRHFEDLTNTEVAQVLKLQPSGASMRYRRALQRLKDILSTIPGIREDLPDDN